MIALQPGFADIGEDLLSAAQHDTALAEALEDYREACRRLSDENLHPNHRADWAMVRDELDVEIRRLFRARKT